MKKTLFRGLLGAALTILVCLPAASRGKGPKKTCEFTDADFRTEKIDPWRPWPNQEAG